MRARDHASNLATPARTTTWQGEDDAHWGFALVAVPIHETNGLRPQYRRRGSGTLRMITVPDGNPIARA